MVKKGIFLYFISFWIKIRLGVTFFFVWSFVYIFWRLKKGKNMLVPDESSCKFCSIVYFSSDDITRFLFCLLQSINRSMNPVIHCFNFVVTVSFYFSFFFFNCIFVFAHGFWLWSEPSFFFSKSTKSKATNSEISLTKRKILFTCKIQHFF